MYSPKYFPGTYFPRRYFPPGGLTATPVTGVALKYFPPDYFAPSYFAPNYFPDGVSSLVSGYPEDLFEAIARFFASSTAIQAAGFTGIWADAKPRGEANPCVVVKIPDGSRMTSDSDHHWNKLRPSLIVQAKDKSVAAVLSEVLFSEFRNQTFAYGSTGQHRTAPLWLVNQRRSKDALDTAGGDPVFRSILDFECIEFRARY